VSALLALSPPTYLHPLADPTCMVLVSEDSICRFELTVPTNTQEHLWLQGLKMKIDMALYCMILNVLGYVLYSH